jgi:hypothetical protein
MRFASSRDHDPGPERQLCKIVDQQVGAHLPFARKDVEPRSTMRTARRP